MAHGTCRLCGQDALLEGRRCRPCRWKARRRAPCIYCNEPTGWGATDPRAATASHPGCRPLEHGTRRAYREAGCRCQPCRDWAADGRRRQVERHGKFYIARAARRELYERDGWTCQLCLGPVDRSAHHLAPWAPTLDHIVPRSVRVDDSPANLRTAHRWCNMVLNDGRKYDESFFKEAS